MTPKQLRTLAIDLADDNPEVAYAEIAYTVTAPLSFASHATRERVIDALIDLLVAGEEGEDYPPLSLPRWAELTSSRAQRRLRLESARYKIAS